VSQRIHVDPSGWHQWEERCQHSRFFKLFGRQQLHLSYQRLDGTNVQRLVNPLGLVAKEVSGTQVSGSGGAFLPRVRTQCTDELSVFVQSNSTWRTAIDGRVHSQFASLCGNAACLPQRSWRYAGHFARLRADQSTGCRGLDSVSIRFDVEEEACALCWGLAQMEVVEPLELRDRVCKRQRGDRFPY